MCHLINWSGQVESYGFTLYEDGYTDTFHSRFHYETGRSQAFISVEWGLYGQNVTVNGQLCSSAELVWCSDGHVGYQLDCSNVVNVDGPLTHDPCSF